MKPALHHLPDWMQTRCAVCDEYALPESGIISSNGKPWQHFNAEGCRRNRERLATLPVEATVMHQALVEASQTLGVFVSECSEASWTPEVEQAVFAAIGALDRGLDAHKLVGFEAQESA